MQAQDGRPRRLVGGSLLGEGVRDCADNPDPLLEGKLSRPIQPGTKGITRYIGHHVIEIAMLLTRIEQRQDMGMQQLCADLDFPQKPLGSKCRGEFWPQHFDGDIPTVTHVLSEIDSCHSAGAQLALDAKSAGKRHPDVNHGRRTAGWSWIRRLRDTTGRPGIRVNLLVITWRVRAGSKCTV